MNDLLFCPAAVKASDSLRCAASRSERGFSAPCAASRSFCNSVANASSYLPLASMPLRLSTKASSMPLTLPMRSAAAFDGSSMASVNRLVACGMVSPMMFERARMSLPNATKSFAFPWKSMTLPSAPVISRAASVESVVVLARAFAATSAFAAMAPKSSRSPCIDNCNLAIRRLEFSAATETATIAAAAAAPATTRPPGPAKKAPTALIAEPRTPNPVPVLSATSTIWWPCWMNAVRIGCPAWIDEKNWMDCTPSC